MITLIVLVWAYPFEIKTSYGNFKVPPFSLDRRYNLYWGV